MSTKFTPMARWRMRTSPGPGSPTGTSTSCMTSGPPCALIWIALMVASPGTLSSAGYTPRMSSSPIAVVTGGAGFIGSHTVDRLIELGHRVVVLDDFSTGKRANLARWLDPKHAFDGAQPALEVVVCDVSHGIFAALAPITARYGKVERIVHLAAQVSVVHSVANPLVDMQINYGGTLHVLEYARAMGVAKVAFASSAAV